MLKGKWKLFICIALVTCVIFTASNDVFAAINEDYYTNNVLGNGVYDDQIENKLESSSLLDAIGSLIYSIGSLIELLVAKVFQLVTGSNMFPWADSILFNAVPFLDVNIFTASGGSLVSILYDFLTEMYYSLLTLASTFFGIAVMFSAVKLAITAIAEDKAKYKKAIVDWLLGLVMLWGIHFFISFVLYLNEQLVVVASNIAAKEVEKNGAALLESTNTDLDADEIVENFILRMTEGHITFNWFKPARGSKLSEGIDKFGEDFFNWEVMDEEKSKKIIRDNAKIAAKLCNNDNFKNYTFQHQVIEDEHLHAGSAASPAYIKCVALHVQNIVNMDEDTLKAFEDEAAVYASKLNKDDDEDAYYRYLTAMISVAKKYRFNSSTENSNAFVSNLAYFFKNAAWTREKGAWTTNRVSIANAIMYVIFVCYSVVFFISYTKRLFYIIMLILMAPIVVVFNFFMSFGR